MCVCAEQLILFHLISIGFLLNCWHYIFVVVVINTLYSPPNYWNSTFYFNHIPIEWYEKTIFMFQFDFNSCLFDGSIQNLPHSLLHFDKRKYLLLFIQLFPCASCFVFTCMLHWTHKKNGSNRDNFAVFVVVALCYDSIKICLLCIISTCFCVLRFIHLAHTNEWVWDSTNFRRIMSFLKSS